MVQEMFRDGLTVEDFFLSDTEAEDDAKAREAYYSSARRDIELGRVTRPMPQNNHIRKFLRLSKAYHTQNGELDEPAFRAACDLAMAEMAKRKAAKGAE